MTPKLVGAPEDRRGPGHPREASGEGRARVESGRVSVSGERWGCSQERKRLGRGLGQGAGTPGEISGLPRRSRQRAFMNPHWAPQRAQGSAWGHVLSSVSSSGCQALCKECV